jgi:hypothetical protein
MKRPVRLIIHDALVAQLLEELADVGADFGGIGSGELGLQPGDDFTEGSFAVAAFEDLATGALEFDGAFGEENHAFFYAGLGFGSPAAAWGEAGFVGVLGWRHL